MKYTDVIDRLREAKRDALANSCNIKIGRRELEVALKALNIVSKELPDMREKIKEYISELDVEIDRCHKLAEQNIEDNSTNLAEMMFVRVQVLTDVRNDLQGRLEELV